MKIKNILFAACLFAGAFGASAMVDSAKLLITKTDNSVLSETIKLEKIDANTMRLKIPFSKFPRGGKTAFDKVKSLDVIIDDAGANKGDDGYWVLSDGRLGKFTRDNGSLVERRNPMPLYGVKKGNEAFVAIIKGLKYEFSTCVEAKDGVYKIYPRFHIAEIGMPPYEDIVIDFTYFKGDDANYSSMGKAYRKYQLDRGEVRPLKERMQGNPTLKYSVDTIFLKMLTSKFMYDQQPSFNWKETELPVIDKVYTFEEMKGQLKKLKDMGIDKADIVLTNWNLRANGMCPIYGKAEPELGGNAKLRELTACGKELGYQIGPHILHTEHYTVSPAFCEDDLARQLDGKYIHYNGMGGEAYCPCFKQVYLKYVLENYTNMQELGFNGPLHIDVTSAITPYPCFNLAHPCTRKDCAFYMNQIGKVSRGLFGAFSSESSCDQVANTLDYAFYVSAYPRWIGAENTLMDAMVPIWQIAYHGIILSNPFFYTIDGNMPRGKNSPAQYNQGTPETRRIKIAEFGGRPSYYGGLSKPENYKYVKQAYDEYQPLKHLQLEFMDFHGEIAPDVFITEFSDGSKIVSNYTKKDFNYMGSVVKALDYRLFAPEPKKQN